MDTLSGHTVPGVLHGRVPTGLPSPSPRLISYGLSWVIESGVISGLHGPLATLVKLVSGLVPDVLLVIEVS